MRKTPVPEPSTSASRPPASPPNQHTRITSELLGRVPTHTDSVFIEKIQPCVSRGRYPIKRVVGQPVHVSADILKDGHDVVRAVVQWRLCGASVWEEADMRPVLNDRWEGTFYPVLPGDAEYRIVAWGDAFASWQAEVAKKAAAGQPEMTSEALEGAVLIRQALHRTVTEADRKVLANIADQLDIADRESLPALAASAELTALMSHYTDRSLETASQPLGLRVERSGALFAAWYEFFPRSAEGRGDAGSTFRDCLGRVDDAHAMGFDVIYFPPIHPIGETKRKGKNNSLLCEPDDPGVPYAIGNWRQGVNGGGHKDVAPELGSLEDFRWLVSEIRNRGMEVALDFAINCSPDHPYVRDHPEWFFHRPDGTIKYAENPPKKYEDIYPLNFHNEHWKELWAELRSIFAFWCEYGVKIFRVDNPHTKPVAFWEWVIADIQSEYPDTIFLSEAFTRPKMMQALAKVGFTQSYTYFTWRNSKHELEEYLTELTRSGMRDYFRPHFFTNTPDILPFFLQEGGRPAFCLRAVLAATLSPLYGIYSGFELCENQPIPGREEYINSEKYQFKERDWNAPGHIKEYIGKLNHIRKTNRALRTLDNLQFEYSENPSILFYSKATPAGDNVIFVAVTHDPHNTQSGFVGVPIERLGIRPDEDYEMEDQLTGETYRWRGSRAFVSLNPGIRPAHVFRLKRGCGRSEGSPVFA